MPSGLYLSLPKFPCWCVTLAGGGDNAAAFFCFLWQEKEDKIDSFAFISLRVEVFKIWWYCRFFFFKCILIPDIKFSNFCSTSQWFLAGFVWDIGLMAWLEWNTTENYQLKFHLFMCFNWMYLLYKDMYWSHKMFFNISPIPNFRDFSHNSKEHPHDKVGNFRWLNPTCTTLLTYIPPRNMHEPAM